MIKNNTKRNKAVLIVLTVLSVLIFVFAVCVFALSVYAKSNGKQAAFFGYSFSLVLTDSMSPEIKVGELVAVKHGSIERAQIGENAVYIAPEGHLLEGQRIIHKIIKKGTDERGTYVITQGVASGAPEDAPVYAEDFVGIGVAHSAFLGAIVGFFSNTLNWVFLTVFLFGIWLAVRQIRKLIAYTKPEQDEGAPPSERSADGENKHENS